MVHALSEAHRVLRPGGAMIDLRPAMNNRRVELEMDGARLLVGEIDYSYRFPDHIAADEAIQTVIAQGKFRLEHRASLEYVTYLDSAEDLREYENSLPQDSAPEGLLRRVDALTQDEADYLISVRRELAIARYRRL